MKQCSTCGALQADSRFFCVDCGEKLGNSLSENELETIGKEIEKKAEKLYNKTDPLYVSIFEKIVGILSLLCMSFTLAFVIIYRHNLEKVPEATYLIYLILAFIFISLLALVPQIFWALEKFKLSFTVVGADDLEPSYLYLVMRRIFIGVSFAIAAAALVHIILQLVNPSCLPLNINVFRWKY